MLERLGLIISDAFRRVIPDPFVIAIMLTAVAGGLALALAGASPRDVATAWAGEDGVWGLLRFGMQMCLILVTGHALASSPPVARALAAVGRWARSPRQAVWLVATCATVLGVLHWGLGLIGGAILARDVGQGLKARGVRVHYPLLAAAGYAAMLVWHGGFSGSIPLKMTTLPDLVEILGDPSPIGPIPLTATILSPLNLFVTGGLLVLLPLIAAGLTPREDRADPPPPVPASPERSAPAADKSSVARWLEDTPIPTLILVLLMGAWAVDFYLPRPGRVSGLLTLTPDDVNLTILLLGLVLHRTPANYLRAAEHAVAGCAGIILQFPLYAGIMGIVRGTGLTTVLATAAASVGSPGLLPLVTMLTAAVVNLFVPSGGGQWAVQGPVAIEAALRLGADPARVAMAVAYGDQLTNMVQPFWALPLLAITGVRARDIMGYAAILMIVALGWIVLGLTLL